MRGRRYDRRPHRHVSPAWLVPVGYPGHKVRQPRRSDRRGRPRQKPSPRRKLQRDRGFHRLGAWLRARRAVLASGKCRSLCRHLRRDGADGADSPGRPPPAQSRERMEMWILLSRTAEPQLCEGLQAEAARIQRLLTGEHDARPQPPRCERMSDGRHFDCFRPGPDDQPDIGGTQIAPLLGWSNLPPLWTESSRGGRPSGNCRRKPGA